MRHRSRKPGFTLVELMVTISVIILLAGTLAPSVFQAFNNWKRMEVKGQLTSIRMGIWAYRNEKSLGGSIPPSQPPAPAAVDIDGNPLTGYYSTGAEALAYYMLGPAGKGFKIVDMGIQGHVDPKYGASAEEVRLSHDASIKTGGNWMGLSSAPAADAPRRVFVDKYSSTSSSSQVEKTRPILYWAARSVPDADNYYVLSDNEDIVKNVNGPYTWSQSDYATAFKERMKYQNDRYLDGFILQSAGEDRMFMTPDDIIEFTEAQ
jgi:prepilin-type N-terminal cleavage/methylation domain-containing protein